MKRVFLTQVGVEVEDVGKGFCELLGQLTTIGEITEAQFASRWAELSASEDYKIVVIEDTESGKLVGSATLFVEKKFIHGCGKVGHVEDVVVDSSCRGQKLGLKLINALSQEAEAAGCYKIILDCSEHNVPFYEKCGYERKGAQMAKYFE